MNKEAYKIRMEIGRLKQRLLEIDEDNLNVEEAAQLSASNVCGQDVTLEHIQKLCNERDSEDIAIMAAWSRKKGWYSTTITPKALPYLLRTSKTIIDYFLPIMNEEKLKIMELLSYENQQEIEQIIKRLDIEVNELDSILIELEKLGLVECAESKWKLSSQGWHTYVSLGHVGYNYTYKVSIEKILQIAPVFMETFNVSWGLPIGCDYKEAIEILRKANKLERLYEHGVTDDDIERAVYESNILNEIKL